MQLLEEPGVYQVIPFMTHLELNHIKDDKTDSEKAHKGQEAVKLIHAGLQAEYKHRFKLQVSNELTQTTALCYLYYAMIEGCYVVSSNPLMSCAQIRLMLA